MAYVTCYPEATSEYTLPARVLKVYQRSGEAESYVDLPVRWIRPVHIVRRTGSEPDLAVLELIMDSTLSFSDGTNTIPATYRMEDYADQLAIHSVVAVKLEIADPDGGDPVVQTLFRGTVVDAVPRWTPDGEAVQYYCAGFREELSRQSVYGQYAEGYDNGNIGAVDTVQVDRPCHFNPAGHGNWSILPGNSQFADDAYTQFGTYADWRAGYALHYLTTRHGSDNVEAIGTEGVDGLNDLYIYDINVDGLPTTEAIDRICRHVGWDWYLEPADDPNDKATLVFFPRSYDADRPQKTVKLQAAGTRLEPVALDLDESNAERGDINFDAKNIVNFWNVLGNFEEFEGEFTLTKAWDADLEDPDHQEYFEFGEDGNASKLGKRRDVYRKYTLHETDGPYNFGTLFALSSTNTTGKFEKKKRRFLKCFPLTQGGQPRDPVVLYKAEEGDDWKTLTGVDYLEDECGIWINTKELPHHGTFYAIKITAVVQSDTRVASTLTQPRDSAYGSGVTIKRTMIVPDKFFWRHRCTAAAGSVGVSYYAPQHDLSDFAAEDVTYTGAFQNDATRIDDFIVKRLDQSEGIIISAGVTIPWVDTGYSLGDFITKLEGREIELRANVGDNEQYPQLVRLTWNCNEQTTELLLSDNRNREGE